VPRPRRRHGVLEIRPLRPTPRGKRSVRGGHGLEELRRRNDRGHAMAAMCRGATRVIVDLHRDGRIQGIIAAGGSANTTIGSAA